MPDEQSMIDDLREIEEELRNREEYRKANIIDLFIRHCVHCKISKESIIKEINELDKKEKEELKGTKSQDRYFIKQQYMYQRNILQKILNK